MDNRGDGSATRADTSIRSVLRPVAAVVAGVVVTIGAALGLVTAGESILATVVWAPFLGGIVTGVCASRKLAVGALAGIATGTVVGITLLAGVVGLLSSAATTTGGAGLAIALSAFATVVTGAAAVVLTTIGAVLGTATRRVLETERTAEAVDERAPETTAADSDSQLEGADKR